jgi:hypothetical protein
VNLTDVSIVVGIVVGVVAVLGVFARFALWAWRGVWRAAQRFTRAVDTIDETAHLVKYHLGPNSDSPAIHERLAEVERVVCKQERV